MTTWFDRLRGSAQGRCQPQGFDPPDGSHVFILGGEDVPEAAVLSGGNPTLLVPGDFSEIKQIVDLSDWDLVAATMDTIGTIMGQAQPAPGFPAPPSGNELWHFNYDIGLDPARNLVAGAFDLDNVGDIEVGVETYSPMGTRCRVIPVGSVTAGLAAVNTPQWFAPSPLNNYTAQFWLNFDAVAHATSWGVNPYLFYCRDGVPAGWHFGLSGAVGPGAHSWRFAVGHHFGGSSVTVFNGYTIDTPNPGWKLITVTWDRFALTWDRLLMYIDDNPVPYTPFAAMANSPQAPALATPITAAAPLLWGAIDEMRMIDTTLTPAEIAASYAACTSMPTPIDYAWLMQIIINAEVYAERVIAPDEQRRWTDFKAPVRHLAGACEVGFRLTLQEA